MEDFHPSSDRAVRLDGIEEGLSPLAPRDRPGHDFDTPAWRRPAVAIDHRPCARRAPRLIDLERRARFARLQPDLQ